MKSSVFIVIGYSKLNPSVSYPCNHLTTFTMENQNDFVFSSSLNADETPIERRQKCLDNARLMVKRSQPPGVDYMEKVVIVRTVVLMFHSNIDCMFLDHTIADDMKLFVSIFVKAHELKHSSGYQRLMLQLNHTDNLDTIQKDILTRLFKYWYTVNVKNVFSTTTPHEFFKTLVEYVHIPSIGKHITKKFVKEYTTYLNRDWAVGGTIGLFFDILFKKKKNANIVKYARDTLKNMGMSIPNYVRRKFETPTTCPTNEHCIVSYEEVDVYMKCKSNIPHVVSKEVYEKLDKKVCPYCRSEYDPVLYKNCDPPRRSGRNRKQVDRLMF